MTNQANVEILPCPLCRKAPGVRIGPPKLIRCITDGCHGKTKGALLASEWQAYATTKTQIDDGCYTDDPRLARLMTESEKAKLASSPNHPTPQSPAANAPDAKLFAEVLREWWRFSDTQQPKSSWHEREDFIEHRLPDLLRQCRSHSQPENDARQKVVIDWGIKAFGADHMADKIVRAARFFEEASELVQAVGLPRDHAMRAFEHAYSRPAGEVAQEIWGSANTLMALAGAVGLSFDSCQQAEIARCLAKDPSHFAERNKVKVRDVDAPAAGTGLQIAWDCADEAYRKHCYEGMIVEIAQLRAQVEGARSALEDAVSFASQVAFVDDMNGKEKLAEIANRYKVGFEAGLLALTSTELRRG